MTKNDAVERAAYQTMPILGQPVDEWGRWAIDNRVEIYEALQALQTSRPDAEILDSPELLEKLAAIEHARWARWYIWQQTNDTPGNRARWGVQAITLYSGLTEREKESDRKEVREYLEVIRAALKSGDKGRCEVCEGTGRLGCLPDDNEHTHPCDTCQPEANKEFQREVAFGEAVARSE